jgi:putative polyhydroxyalkanoate system protein
LSDICIHHPHSLGVERARAVVDHLILKIRERYPHALHQICWNHERTAATVSGRGVTGTFEIGSRHLAVEIKLSRLMRPLRHKAERKIREKLHEYFT